MDLITTHFLSNEGITAAEADCLANVARGMRRTLEDKVQRLKLVSKDFSPISGGESSRMENESSHEELAAITGLLNEIASFNALEEWLSKGVEELQKLYSERSQQVYIDKLIRSGRTDLDIYHIETPPTLEDAIAAFSMEDRVRYLALETKDEVLSYLVDMVLRKACKDYFAPSCKPASAKRSRANAGVTFISKFSSEFTPEEVNSAYHEWMKEADVAKAEFIEMKVRVEETLAMLKQEYSREEGLRRIRCEERIKAELAEYRKWVDGLRVYVPVCLEDIYRRVRDFAGPLPTGNRLFTLNGDESCHTDNDDLLRDEES